MIHYDVILRSRRYPEDFTVLGSEISERTDAERFGRGALSVLLRWEAAYEGNDLVVVEVDSETYRSTGKETVL